MNSQARTTSLLAALALMLPLAACSSDSQPARATQVIDGYELDGKYSSALDYPGNDAIFTVRVSGRQAAKMSDRISSEANDRYVYTPIDAVVIEVLKAGDADVRPGQEVVLRVLGGSTETLTTRSEISASPADYALGTQIQVFAQPVFTDPVTGERQYVPNWAFSIIQGQVTNLHEREQTLTAGAAQVQAQEVAAWRGWQR